MSSLVDERRILVTGSSGQVGTALQSVLPQATFLTRGGLDLGDLASIPRVIDAHRPSAVINCAAYTNVDLAEHEEERATIINGAAVGELARACAERAIPLVTYSSDYVFDGRSSTPYTEGDRVGPVGAYGRSKLIGERLALEHYPGALVVRTSWVISATHNNFVATMIRLARNGPLDVVDDQRGKPTIADDLAVATVTALNAGSTGIMHLANDGETTWFGLAAATVQLAGLDPALVMPCTTDEFPTTAARPAYSVLGTNRADTPRLPSWRDSLVPLVAGQIRRL